MFAKKAILITCLLSLSIAYDKTYFQGPDYEAQCASDKFNQIWTKITEDTTPHGWRFSLFIFEIFIEAMKPTFRHVGDTMPSRLFFFTRNKVVHTQGVVTQVKLIPSGNSHPFTGMFRGADFGVMRMSLATKPKISTTDTTKNNLVPAIGLKLLRSGVESANVVLIGSRDGQTSENFFENPFSNHIPATSDKTSLKLLSKRFSKATPFVSNIGLLDFSTYDQNGDKVPVPKFPWRIKLVPTQQVKQPNFQQDFDFTKSLMKIPSGTVMFDVRALDAPRELGGVEYIIGSIVSQSEVTTSHWGDTRLFFRHHDMTFDLQKEPSWFDYTPYVGKIENDELPQNQKLSAIPNGCPFAYLF